MKVVTAEFTNINSGQSKDQKQRSSCAAFSDRHVWTNLNCPYNLYNTEYIKTPNSVQLRSLYLSAFTSQP